MKPELGLPDVVPDLPEWLQPVAEGAARIEGEDLTQFLPPRDAHPRRGSVLMLFGEDTDGAGGPDLLLTERAHDMRSHPGQVSFPGGKIDPGETPVQAAVREAQEEIGVAPDTVEVFAALPELWLPPSNFAVTPVIGWWREPHPVRIASPQEVHEIHRVSLAELIDPDHRIQVRHPSGWVGPGFLIGEAKDVILWGFTGGIITRFFDFLGWLPPVPDPPLHELPDHMVAEYAGRDQQTHDELDILEEDDA